MDKWGIEVSNMLLVPVLVGFTSMWLLFWFLQGDMKRLPLPPGPRGLPFVGSLHLLGNLPYRDFAKMAEKYGPIMHLRLGSVTTIVVSSPEMAKEILRTQDKIFADRPKIGKLELFSFDGYQDIAFGELTPNLEYLKRICREEIVPARQLAKFQDTRRSSILMTIQSLLDKSKEQKPVQINHELMELFFNTICNMMFRDGTKLGEYSAVITKVMHTAGLADIGDFMPWLAKLDLFGYNKELKRLMKILDSILQNVIDEHRGKILKTGVNEMQDLVDVCLSLPSKDGNGPMADGQIKALLNDLVTAGSETQSASMEWTLVELLRNPNVLQKAQDEIAAVVGTDRLVEELDTSKMGYVKMIIMETMRLHPVGPLLIPRQSTQDCSVAGYRIPAKSRVFINAFRIHTDPSVWERPLEFNPDRFTNPEVQPPRQQRFDHLPFGSGRRRCPAADMANQSMTFTLSQLLHCFDWGLQNGTKPADVDMTEVFGIACTMAVPLTVVPKPRLAAHVYDQLNQKPKMSE